MNILKLYHLFLALVNRPPFVNNIEVQWRQGTGDNCVVFYGIVCRVVVPVLFEILEIFKWKFWVEGGEKGMSQIKKNIYNFFFHSNKYHTLIQVFSFFVYFFWHSVFLCKQDALLQNFQNLNIIYFFFLQMGKIG